MFRIKTRWVSAAVDVGRLLFLHVEEHDHEEEEDDDGAGVDQDLQGAEERRAEQHEEHGHREQRRANVTELTRRDQRGRILIQVDREHVLVGQAQCHLVVPLLDQERLGGVGRL